MTVISIHFVSFISSFLFHSITCDISPYKIIRKLQKGSDKRVIIGRWSHYPSNHLARSDVEPATN